MRLIIFLLLTSFFVLPSLPACGQDSTPPPSIDSTPKLNADSLVRVKMKDLLSLSDQTVTTMFALKDTGAARADRIVMDQSLTPTQKNTTLQNLRIETTNAIKNLLGTETYSKYLILFAGKEPYKQE